MTTAWVEHIKGYGLGWLLALVVLLMCVAFYLFGKALTSNEALLFIGLLALARML